MASTTTIPRVWVSSITFKDGTEVRLGARDRVLLIGSNNVGKSDTLGQIYARFDRLTPGNSVVSNVELGMSGDAGDVLEWAGQSGLVRVEGKLLHGQGGAMNVDHIQHFWNGNAPVMPVDALRSLFCLHVKGEGRLQYSSARDRLDDPSQQPPGHPLHALDRDPRMDAALSALFREAFGTGLVVNRGAGKKVHLRVGDLQDSAKGLDSNALEFKKAVEALPQLESQGDGMRSFASVLLAATLGQQSLLLVDEPEAFLHPPQARSLGGLLGKDSAFDRQVIVATHSTAVLQGFLDSGGECARIIRLRRNGGVEEVCELSNDDMKELSSNSLLRESNVFDGLFHEQVVVCEGDSDCRFYGAVFKAMTSESTAPRPPDTMFVHCGGKDRLAVVARTLRATGVPVRVIADLDLLHEDHNLRSCIEALGGTWTDFADRWKQVTKAIQDKKPELTAGEVFDEIEAQSKGQDRSAPLERSRRIQIQKALKRSTVWANLKESGSTFIPRGPANNAFEALVSDARALGLNIVAVGQVEGFDRRVDMKSAKWVNEVLASSDLAIDSGLEPARRFVQMSCIDPLPE